MTKSMLSATAVALLLAAGPALAQTATDEVDEQQVQPPAMEAPAIPEAPADEAAEIESEVDAPAVAAAPSDAFLSLQEEGDILASELIGTSVENPQGESLGNIRDVVINDTLGVKAVVIGVGGFLGIGQKSVAVNYQAIEQVRENGQVTLVFAATRDELGEAPAFQTLRDQIAEAELEQMETERQMQMDESPAAPLD